MGEIIHLYEDPAECIRREAVALTDRLLNGFSGPELEQLIHTYTAYRGLVQVAGLKDIADRAEELNDIAALLSSAGEKMKSLVEKMDVVEAVFGHVYRDVLSEYDPTLLETVSEPPLHGYFLTFIKIAKASKDPKYMLECLFDEPKRAEVLVLPVQHD